MPTARAPKHFNLSVNNGIAEISLTGADRKNPLTFDSYAELRDWFRDLVYEDDINAVVFGPNGGNFCSGGDVHDIIGPLVSMSMKELLNFTRMTGDLVKAMINCGKPVIAAIDGVCVGAGAIIAMASDLRIATPEAKTAFFIHPRWIGGMRYGGLCNIAAYHWPRPGRGPAVYRAINVGQRRHGLGVFHRDHPGGRAARHGDGTGHSDHIRAQFWPYDDQDNAGAGMVHVDRTGDRGRSTGPGHLHADRRFRTRLSGFCRQEKTKI